MEEKKIEAEKHRGVAMSAANLKWEMECGSLYKLCTGSFLFGVAHLLYLSLFNIGSFSFKIHRLN